MLTELFVQPFRSFNNFVQTTLPVSLKKNPVSLLPSVYGKRNKRSLLGSVFSMSWNHIVAVSISYPLILVTTSGDASLTGASEAPNRRCGHSDCVTDASSRSAVKNPMIIVFRNPLQTSGLLK